MRGVTLQASLQSISGFPNSKGTALLMTFRDLALYVIASSTLLPTAYAQTLLGSEPDQTIQRPTLPIIPRPGGPTVSPDALNAQAERNRERCEALEPKLSTSWYPGFDWRMPARYGHDRKVYKDDDGNPVGNGIVDLPNTTDYVMNIVSASNAPEDACSCKRNDEGVCEARFRVNFTIAGGRRANWTNSASSIRSIRDQYACPAIDFPDLPVPTYRWTVDGETTIDDGSGTHSACLTEGHHPVTLQVTYEGQTKAVTRPIEVIDHLIVNLGDSYGAGEGTPETNFRPERMIPLDNPGGGDEWVDWTQNHMQEIPFFAQWADPGIEIPMDDNTVYAYSELKSEIVDYDGKSYALITSEWENATYKGTVRMPVWETIKASIVNDYESSPFRVLMDHHHAHRSSATGASQLALHLEHSDEKSSVTFVNLAASGATTQNGLLGPYNGVFELKGRKDMDTYLPRYQGQVGLRPQLDEMNDLLDTRMADDVFISIGGNDVGFANMIAVFMAAWDGDSYEVERNSGGGLDWIGVDNSVANMLKRFRDGQWTENDFGLSLFGLFVADFKENVAGLNGLQDEYRAIARKIEDLNDAQPTVARVSFIGYPDFSSAARDDIQQVLQGEKIRRRITDPETGQDIPKVHYCDLRVSAGDDPTVNDASVKLDFDPVEFRLASRAVLRPLNSEIESSVRVLRKYHRGVNWNFIDQGHEPAVHGICGFGNYNRYDFADVYAGYKRRTGLDGEIGSGELVLNESVGDRDGTAWYRNPFVGAAVQRGGPVSNTGLFHPNEYGYRHVGRRMLEELEFYGAEFGRDDRFSDPDDAIAENARIRGQEGDSFEGTLTGSHDVSMFVLAATGRRCLPTTLRVTADRPVALTAFARNGEVIASTLETRKPTPPPESKSIRDLTRGLTPGADDGDTLTAIVPRASGITRITRSQSDMVIDPALLAEDTRYCQPEDYDWLASLRDEEAARTQDTNTVSLTYFTESYPAAYIAVSHPQNDQFDPVTGRGDDRRDLDRRSIRFEGIVTYAVKDD